MSAVSIPNWTAQGVIPPIDVIDPTSANRSPYRVTATDFALRFGTSKDRCGIIDGLLRYREALHAAGLASGFQWIDGSFLEQVETLESRPPNDVDVVTFYDLPAGETQRSIQAKNADLFDHDKVKVNFHVDAFLVHLAAEPTRLVSHSAYWYSVWSHRRNQAWKGYVEIDLDGSDDQAAAAMLVTCPGMGCMP